MKIKNFLPRLLNWGLLKKCSFKNYRNVPNEGYSTCEYVSCV